MPDAANTPLAGLEDSLQAAQSLLQSRWRNLAVYAPIVQPRLFDAQAFIAALRTRLLQQPRARGRLLLPPASDWRRDCPRLAALLERLSALELRWPDPHQNAQRTEASHMFMVTDEMVLRHVDPQRGYGYFAQSDRRQAHELKGYFEDAWERAFRDAELRYVQL